MHWDVKSLLIAQDSASSNNLLIMQQASQGFVKKLAVHMLLVVQELVTVALHACFLVLLQHRDENMLAFQLRMLCYCCLSSVIGLSEVLLPHTFKPHYVLKS